MPSIATMAMSIQPGHDNCPPTPAASGEPLVTINWSPVMLGRGYLFSFINSFLMR